MKRRGRPPRNRAIEEARQENGDTDKIPPMAGEASGAQSVCITINGQSPEEYGVSVNYDPKTGVITTHPAESVSKEDSKTSETAQRWREFQEKLHEADLAAFLPKVINFAEPSTADTLHEAAKLVPDSMLEAIRLEMGGVLPNAWGLTNPKVIIAAVVRVYERGWV